MFLYLNAPQLFLKLDPHRNFSNSFLQTQKNPHYQNSAIFGPQDTLLGNHIQSLCDALEIPHLEARLDLEPQVKEVSINLYPNARLIGQAIRDLVTYLNWTSVAVIYEDDICKCQVKLFSFLLSYYHSAMNRILSSSFQWAVNVMDSS